MLNFIPRHTSNRNVFLGISKGVLKWSGKLIIHNSSKLELLKEFLSSFLVLENNKELINLMLLNSGVALYSSQRNSYSFNYSGRSNEIILQKIKNKITHSPVILINLYYLFNLFFSGVASHIRFCIALIRVHHLYPVFLLNIRWSYTAVFLITNI